MCVWGSSLFVLNGNNLKLSLKTKNYVSNFIAYCGFRNLQKRDRKM